MDRIYLKRSVNVGTEVLHYREQGSGPLLFLLHGYGGSPNDWEEIAQKLSKKYRVVRPDLSPFYTNPIKPYAFKTQVGMLEEFIAIVSCDDKNYHIAAASYGGALAWGFAVNDHEKLLSLALVNPMPPHPKPKVRDKTLKLFLQLSRWPLLLILYLKTPFGKVSLPVIEKIFHVPWMHSQIKDRKLAKMTHRKLRVITHVIHRFSWIIHEEDWSYWESRLRFISVPIKLIWGKEDRLFIEDEPQRFEKLFSICHLHMVDKAGHLAMKENPDVVSQILEDFLETHQRAA